MKRTVAFILAMMMSVCLALSVYADEEHTELLIQSEAPPTAVTNYALEVYSRLHEYDLRAIGLSGWQLEDLSLSPGVRVRHSVNESYIDGIWCFPIKAMGKFTAILLITQHGSKYGFELMQNEVTQHLNEQNRWEPYRLFISGDKMYVGVKQAATCDEIDINKDIYGMPDCYNDELDHKVLPMNICDIKVFDYVGTCWASASASIIGYEKQKNSQESIMEIRDEIVDLKQKATGDKTGTLSVSCGYIERLTGIKYGRHDSKLKYSDLRMLIDNNSPSIIEYISDNADFGHAVVVCGYSMLSEKESDEKYQAYYILDPNRPDYGKVMVGYSGIYHPALMVIDNGAYVSPQYVWTATGVDKSYKLSGTFLEDLKSTEGIIALIATAAIIGVGVTVIIIREKKNKSSKGPRIRNSLIGGFYYK